MHSCQLASFWTLLTRLSCHSSKAIDCRVITMIGENRLKLVGVYILATIVFGGFGSLAGIGLRVLVELLKGNPLSRI